MEIDILVKFINNSSELWPYSPEIILSSFFIFFFLQLFLSDINHIREIISIIPHGHKEHNAVFIAFN